MNGILCMNKPQDFTSFDVIGKLRGILHMKRLGHTGTLDPMATGVLPILVGTATKACDILPNQDKTYQATVVFGKATDTLDIWGKPLQDYPEQHVTEAALRAILPEFLGDITQLPPMYYKEYTPGTIFEFDYFEELRQFDTQYLSHTHSGIIRNIKLVFVEVVTDTFS